MKQLFVFTIFCFALVLLQPVKAQTRETDFNFDWKFQLQKDTLISTKLPLNDADWREVRLPHDWSIELPFDKNLEGCTGYLPGGVAWYQKHFKTPEDSKAKTTVILFDGVYNNAKFWLNGQFIGENPYGYTPVYFDITNLLKKDGSENVISVHVDHSRYADSRWYTGSGIYRNVKLITTNKLHIPVWGTYVTTPIITANSAVVKVETSIKNDQDKSCTAILSTQIIDADGKQVAVQQKEIEIASGKAVSVAQTLEVAQPKLWDTETPNMYKAISTITQNGKVVDVYTTPFGIRSLRFDKDQGFFLNGQSTDVKGVCLHHDGGLVGAAVPKGVWKRRLEKLKEAGCNAIRTSHNPVSAEFLDLCDEMGFLVQNEIFDEMDNPKDKQHNLNERSVQYITRGYTEHFQKWGESDLKRTVMRDRNHPSVFEWSIGNEIEWTYPEYQYVSGLWDPEVKGGYWNKIPQLTAQQMKDRYKARPEKKYKLAETAQRLARWVKALDTTRAVTSNLIIPVASCATGYAGALDVVGFSYQIEQYNWCKKNYPDMLFTGSENSGSWEEWNSVIENPMVFSMFMWTGIDYLGESQDKWPQKGWDGDMLDFAGFEKQGWNHFKSIWVNQPHISIGTLPIKASQFKVDPLSGKPFAESKKAMQWRNSESNMYWNYSPGEMVLVEVCTNLPVVELFLNGKSLGSRSLSDCPDKLLRWAVPYQAGTLTAKGGFDGSKISAELKTTSEPVAVTVTADKTRLKADGYDVAHLIVQLVDKDGNAVKTANAEITFTLEGNARLLGVDNGSNKSIQNFQSNKVITSQGRCLAIIQSVKTAGKVTVTVNGGGFKKNECILQIQ